MIASHLRQELCRAFCDDISVVELDAGEIAISARYSDESGDPVECFIERSESGGWFICDDGQFLPDLIGRGIDIATTARAEYLARSLKKAKAFVDKESLIIKTNQSPGRPTAGQILDFLVCLTKAKDLAFWNKERVKSTFKDDVYTALASKMDGFDLLRNSSIPHIEALQEFPADIVAIPRGIQSQSFAAAIFLVQDIRTFDEALLLWQEAAAKKIEGVWVAAIVEDGRGTNMGLTKVQRAINRIDDFSIWNLDRDASIGKIARGVTRRLIAL